jgi:hypothetical protein
MPDEYKSRRSRNAPRPVSELTPEELAERQRKAGATQRYRARAKGLDVPLLIAAARPASELTPEELAARERNTEAGRRFRAKKRAQPQDSEQSQSAGHSSYASQSSPKPWEAFSIPPAWEAQAVSLASQHSSTRTSRSSSSTTAIRLLRLRHTCSRSTCRSNSSTRTSHRSSRTRLSRQVIRLTRLRVSEFRMPVVGVLLILMRIRVLRWLAGTLSRARGGVLLRGRGRGLRGSRFFGLPGGWRAGFQGLLSRRGL